MAVAVDLKTSVVDVVIGRAGGLPRHLVIVERTPAAGRLPNAAADSEQLVERETPAHSRLPQIAPQRVRKAPDDGRAVAAIHVHAIANAAAQPVEEGGTIEAARTVVRAAAAGTIVGDDARAEPIDALRHQRRRHIRRGRACCPAAGVIAYDGP